MTRQLPLLALLFVAVLFWFGQHLKGILLAANLEIAKRSSMAVVNALQASMVTETTHQVWERVVRKIPRDTNTQIEIIDNRGVVLFSTDAGQSGTIRALNHPTCEVCHAGDAREIKAETAFVRDPQNQRYQVFAAPVRNNQECRTCHLGDKQKLGMVIVRQSLEPIHRQVRSLQIALVIVGLIVLLLTLATTRILLNRYLGRPLKRLLAGAEAIGAGDLQHSIVLSEKNEMAMLADTLNTSTKRLGEMVHRVEQQRDDYQTLYSLTDQLSRAILPAERRRRVVELASKVLKRQCILVRERDHTGSRTGELNLTFQGPQGIVDRRLADDSTDVPVPSFYSESVVERWQHGEFDDQVEVREGSTVAHPLKRRDQRLGLILRPGRPPESDVPIGEPLPDPEMVQALCKHLAIALEFSDLQREHLEQERLAAMGETVAGLAHWLRNTLNGLRAGQYVIDRAMELEDAEKLRTGWRVMKNSIRQVEKLSFDMLYYVKERVPDREPTDPNEVMDEVIELLREMATNQGVELVAELDAGIGQELLDRTSIYRAVLNLVTNAVEACTESETGNRVILKTRATPQEIVLTVEDNGIGMPKAVRRNLFSRFFTTKGSKGTGLGLSVVKKITEEHGGTLEVESVPGNGSAFHMRLPRMPIADRVGKQ